MSEEEQEHEDQRSHQRVSRTVRTTLRRLPLRSLIPIDHLRAPADVGAHAAALAWP